MEIRNLEKVIKNEMSWLHTVIIKFENKGKYGKQASEISPAGSTINPMTGIAIKFDMSAIADTILK